MTPLQAEMLASSMALIASVIADEFHSDEGKTNYLFQNSVAKECQKAFRSQLSSLKIITPEPRTPKNPTGANERKPAHP